MKEFIIMLFDHYLSLQKAVYTMVGKKFYVVLSTLISSIQPTL